MAPESKPRTALGVGFALTLRIRVGCEAIG